MTLVAVGENPRDGREAFGAQAQQAGFFGGFAVRGGRALTTPDPPARQLPAGMVASGTR